MLNYEIQNIKLNEINGLIGVKKVLKSSLNLRRESIRTWKMPFGKSEVSYGRKNDWDMTSI